MAGVTDRRSLGTQATPSRNAPPDYEAAVEHAAALLGGPRRRSPGEQAAVDRYLQAVPGGYCGRCGRALGDAEPVMWWQLRDRVVYGFQAPHCAACAAPASWWKPTACGGCGRPMYCQHDIRRRYCCRPCRDQANDTRRAARTAKARQHKTRPVCGEVFDGTRADQVTCSPACRQKAYRQRKGAG